MRVISLHQPYASLIEKRIKRIETRGRRAPTSVVGQRVAIHAAKRWPVNGEFPGKTGVDLTGDLMYWLEEPWTEEEQVAAGLPPDGDLIGFPLPLGYIVATAVIAECLPIDGPNEAGHLQFLCPDIYGGLTLFRFGNGGWRPATVDLDVADQLPYGDFRDGRWGWLLEDVESVWPPVPFSGGQGWSKSWAPA